VRPAALRGALERFAAFFAAPLIKKDALEREVRAVDSEFKSALQSDAARLQALRAATAAEGHPARKFAWGDRRSLADGPAAAGVDVRSALLAHHAAHYGAARMNLVLLGGEPLDALAAWAAELFGGVPAGPPGLRPSFAAAGAPFAGGALALAPAAREGHRLSIAFPLPCLHAAYQKKADDYLSHLVGHEGRGSLLAALKARGWATELCAGVAEANSAAYVFDVSVVLTEAGLAAGEGAGLAVARLVFEYLALLRAAGPQRWAWDELAAMGAMKFRFQEEEEPAE
jgi:nardilysin